MMLSTHDLRRRIRSVSSTAQITRAMQMVAASKMRKAQQAVLAGRPFGRLLYRIQREATTQAVKFTHPLLEVRPVRKRAVILVSPNQGLCGGLNTNLFHLAAQFEPQTTVFVTAGRKATEFVAHNGRQLGAEFTYADTPRFAEARAIAAFACDLFLKGEVDQVQIVATRFVNTLTQQAASLEFLPIGPITGLKVEGAESEEELAAHATEFLFEPNAQAVLGFLLPHYLNIYLYGVLLNAKASEQSARMVSMKNATENANNLIRDLTLELNKQRQGNITKELLDLAGGQADSA
jgi:F-type H+-transporting ATPase subunit gamma